MADDIICRCKDCVYYHSANGLEKTSGNMMCHFALENGYPRLIPPVDCYKKEGTGYISRKDKNKKKKMEEMKKGALADMKISKRIDQDTKDAAVRAVLVDGERVAVVAERYGVNEQTVRNWKAAYEKKQAEFIEYAETVEAELSSDNDEDLPEFEVIFPASELVEETPGETEKKFDYSILKPRPEPVFRPVGEQQDEDGTSGMPSPTQIKAAAFDEIADITDSYPDRSERELLFYINGIIGLTERLCREN